MTWTSSPKDSVFGLSLLFVIGGSVAGSIAASSWSAVRDTEYRVEPAWAAVGIVVFFGATYAAPYAVNGLLHRAWSSYTRRAGPPVSAALETTAAVLAWGTLVAAFTVPCTLAVVAAALAVATDLKLAGAAVRRWAHRTGNGTLR